MVLSWYGDGTAHVQHWYGGSCKEKKKKSDRVHFKLREKKTTFAA